MTPKIGKTMRRIIVSAIAIVACLALQAQNIRVNHSGVPDSNCEQPSASQPNFFFPNPYDQDLPSRGIGPDNVDRNGKGE